MADTKKGRDKQARDEENRQREWEIEQALERSDEGEPSRDELDVTEAEDEEVIDSTSPPACHRRDCNEPAAFVVLERYQEETGHGAVEAEAFLCRKHTAEESPTNLDGVFAEYVFRVEPLSETVNTDTK